LIPDLIKIKTSLLQLCLLLTNLSVRKGDIEETKERPRRDQGETKDNLMAF